MVTRFAILFFSFLLLLIASACGSASSPATSTPFAATSAPTSRAIVAPDVPALVLQQSDINNLISDEANLFFSICKSPRGGSTDAVYKLTKDSRQVFALATEQNCPDKLAQDALNLYWASNRQLFQISKQGGSAPTVVNAESPVTGLALYQSEIYFSACDSSGAGALFQWMKTAAPKIIARDARCMQIAASDGANIFFIANDRVNGDELWRIAKNGGAVEKIASLARYPVVVGKILADATT
ncbi:MAG: hypothetical protein HY257_05600, partial [Chloroflexi bacterium]|nr:hypothetical protein [Chloroflexota bacterium]